LPMLQVLREQSTRPAGQGCFDNQGIPTERKFLSHFLEDMKNINAMSELKVKIRQYCQ